MFYGCLRTNTTHVFVCVAVACVAVCVASSCSFTQPADTLNYEPYLVSD